MLWNPAVPSSVTLDRSLNLSQDVRAGDNSGAAIPLEAAPVPGNATDAMNAEAHLGLFMNQGDILMFYTKIQVTKLNHMYVSLRNHTNQKGHNYP